MQLNVVSWNIFSAQTLEQIEGVVSHLHKLNPDVIGLQEVIAWDSEVVPFANKSLLIKHLLDEMGRVYESYYVPAFQSDRHPTHHKIGNAIFSKYPIVKNRSFPLSTLEEYWERKQTEVPRNVEPRNAVVAMINVDGKPVWVVNTHLAVSENFQATKYTESQVNTLLINLEQFCHPDRTILMGDFNVDSDSFVMRKIERAGFTNTDTKQLPTWPMLPEGALAHKEKYPMHFKEQDVGMHRIDQQWIGRDLRVLEFSLDRSPSSDHLSLQTIVTDGGEN